MNAIMGHMTSKKGIGNLFSGGGNNYTDDDRIGGIRSQLSNLIGGGQLQQDHPLVQYVQQNAGIQDPQQATQYTQQALEMMNEYANTIHRDYIHYLVILWEEEQDNNRNNII
jgi:hypothetical protein